MNETEIKTDNRIETVNNLLPYRYSIMEINVTNNEIVGIGIIKVAGLSTVTKYIETMDIYKNIKKIFTRVLDIMEDDVVFCYNEESDIQIFKKVCQNMNLTINNQILNGLDTNTNIPLKVRGFVRKVVDIRSEMFGKSCLYCDKN